MREQDVDEIKETVIKQENYFGQCFGSMLGKLDRVRKEQKCYLVVITLLQIIMLILAMSVLL